MNSVRLYYMIHQGESDFARLNENQLNQWISELSHLKKTAVQRLVHDSDRIVSLLATRILKICAQHEGVENFHLSDIHYPVKGKPDWKNRTGNFFDFNISHSDKMIVVAASKAMKVGVDTERIRELINLNFKMVLSTEELMEIQQTPSLFFNFWSKKEAVAKAANTTGIARMRDVQLKQNYAVLDNKKWYLKNIELNKQLSSQYAIHLATSRPVDEVIIKQILLNELD